MKTFEKESLTNTRFEIIKCMLDEFDELRLLVRKHLLNKAESDEEC